MLVPSADAVSDVISYGAVGDGTIDCTDAFQSAIDGCVARGGGTVYVAAGQYLVGTLRLGSRLCMYLDHGATLLGSSALAAYPPQVPELRSYTDNYTCRSLLYAEGAEDIAIVGGGAIDGQGGAFLGRSYMERPYLLRFVQCCRIHLRDVTLRDSAMWVQHYLGCSDVNLDGLTIDSAVNLNNDGIDVDSSERVRISNCDITTGDDAIAIKATSPRPCHDVTISNCTLSSDCNAFKVGTETVGDISDIAMSNCTVRHAGLAGIAIEAVDGGHVERIVVSTVTMRDTAGGIFIHLGDRGRPFEASGTADHYDRATSPPKNPAGILRDVVLTDIISDGGDTVGSSITGLPWAPITDVALREIRLRVAGGLGSVPDDPPDHAEHYPEYNMFGPLPACGLYVRHAQRVRIDELDVHCDVADSRPVLRCSEGSDVSVGGHLAVGRDMAAT